MLPALPENTPEAGCHQEPAWTGEPAGMVICRTVAIAAMACANEPFVLDTVSLNTVSLNKDR